MTNVRPSWLSFALSLCLTSLVKAEVDTPEMSEARAMGIHVVHLMQDNLKSRPAEVYPGIHAWMGGEGAVFQALDKDKPDDSWRKLDSGKLVTGSANFWQMCYEVVPGDPGLFMLHAASLLAAGDPDRAQAILRLVLHRGDLDENTSRILISIMKSCGAFMKPSHALVSKGIPLHDKGDFAGAMEQYAAALRLWPRNGWAAYERGTTFLIQDKGEGTERVKKAFAQARELQPFQFRAWQGRPAEIPGMMEMLTEASELWEASLKDIQHVMKPEELLKFSEILQLAEVDDLALVVRQVCIVRRGRYMPEDHPFISKSLRRLVPGPQAETTIAKLGGADLRLTQIFQAEVL